MRRDFAYITFDYIKYTYTVMGSQTKHKKHSTKKGIRRTKKRGGGIKKKQIRVLFERSLLAPNNINVRIRVFAGPSVPTSVVDFDALLRLLHHYTENVDEQLEILMRESDGKQNLPKKERVINLYINDKDIPMFRGDAK